MGACLLQHRHRLGGEVAGEAARLRRLPALQRAVAADPRAPELGVRVRVIEDVRALALRSRPDSISALFEEAEARAARDRIDSSPFLLLHGPREVEVCVPVRPSSRLRGVREVRGAPLAASITYAGSYAQTAALRARMATWLRRSGLRAAGPLREVYHRFGADQRGYRLPERRLASSSDQFVTELQLPAEEVHAAYLFDHLTPAEVMRRRPDLAGGWYDGPGSQYGRPARFYQQLQALDLAAAWGRIHVPALVVWGEYDFIMDRSDQEQIVRLVGPQARLLVVPHADHLLTTHRDAVAAFRHMGDGDYPSAEAEQIVAFLRGR